MFGLTEQEKLDLLNSTDSKVAGVALKLKKFEEDGKYVPIEKISEITLKKKDAENKLQELLEQKRKLEEEEARKSGDITKLLETEKLRNVELQKKLDEESKLVEEYGIFRKEVTERVKKELGDKWLPEFETFSLSSLLKLAPSVEKLVKVDTRNAPTPPVPTLHDKLQEAIKEGRQAEIISLRRKIAEEENKKK